MDNHNAKSLSENGKGIAKSAGRITGMILGYLLFRNYFISRCIELNSELAEIPILNKVSGIPLILWSVVLPIVLTISGIIMISGFGLLAIRRLFLRKR